MNLLNTQEHSKKYLRFFIALILLLYVHCPKSFCQSIDTPVKEMPISPYYNLVRADSFLNKGDTINAAIYFMKVNPYYLMELMGVTGDSLPKWFDYYKLSSPARNKYKEKFTSCYKQSLENETYQTFKAMFKEDQDTRCVASYVV